MSAISKSIDIDRRPEDVYSYVTDPTHLPEWQDSAVSAVPMGDLPVHIGSRVVVIRQVGKRRIPTTMEFTELDPPRSWHIHGLDGPVRPDVRGRIEPLDGGTRSRVTLSVDFEGHGMGRALVPLAVKPMLRKEMPRSEEKLKHLLEHSAS
ncbi:MULTISPECIES: SRPBCC family protein [unclassified Streptomyces]|uniref:SRPBCC family protein n=1 Tax=unclassified Streptomyces TaxID=2593676 RepID=UPI00214B338B|nr:MULTISPECIES: SRPBCC family protein [unclassified Streptomyces]MCX5010748.1 SRPBCC family protein [Streptomyces sp. NBC_00555]MCX5611209.1 SRPBCC family protein [Streptomyces sp. NBC_00047]UUU39083.1 SRPBCC family protein [Streptomyces sp. NBC_00162]